MRTALVCALLLVPFATSAAILPGDVILESNKERAEARLPLLVPNVALSRAAEARAQDMAETGYFAHAGTDGSSPWKWVRDEGYTFSRAAENLAVNYGSAEAVVAGWMASPGHRANLLDARLSEIGIGTAEGDYKGNRATYVVQFLATPSGTLGQAAAAVQTSVQVIIEPGSAPGTDTVAREAQMRTLIAQLQSLLAILRGMLGA